MLKQFTDIDSLMQAVEMDKNISGAGSYVANRYPIRFVLFDNFRDCYEFVSRQTSKSLFFQSIDLWLNPQLPDTIVTHSKLATEIKKFVMGCSNDSVITPFSELARFYNNDSSGEFHALISTIKSTENSQTNYEEHRRVYIPIVGLFGKMSRFSDDSQCFMWYLKSSDHQLNYNLILTNGTTYNVKGIEEQMTVVTSATEWLKIWKSHDITRNIICTSKAIYANAEYAQPDNAFDYTPCSNVHSFLTEGLNLPLNFIDYKDSDEEFWVKLASEIDIRDFNFTTFFNSKFGIYDLANYKVFFRTWFNTHDAYSRWLLSAYYIHKFCNKGYICQALKNCADYNNSEFFQNLLLTIFDIENPLENLDERNEGICQAGLANIVLPDNIQELLAKKLYAVADKMGYRTALRYLTSVTEIEKQIIIEWLKDGHINSSDIADIYPDLYAYLLPTFGTHETDKSWCLDYFNAYKKAKLSNTYTETIKNYILTKNNNEVTFNSWFNSFQTVRTLMCTRTDIDVYFWIDGLGVEWIPFVNEVIKERKEDNYFLNDILIARSLLPSSTETNKTDLQKLANGDLQKYGDLDNESHKSRPYPTYIIADMKKIRDCVNRILDENPDKKIAIISDHGITYLSQLVPGLNLSGITGDHSGRIATWNHGVAVSDEKYKILDDGRKICALRHESLTSKVNINCGCHGGCTPEEVLVPIFIISNRPGNSSFTIQQKTLELSASNPVAKFSISGLSSIDTPYLVYNSKRYSLHLTTGNIWESEPLHLVANENILNVVIQDTDHIFKVKILLGVEEEDLF